jgi:hypothetical protein
MTFFFLTVICMSKIGAGSTLSRCTREMNRQSWEIEPYPENGKKFSSIYSQDLGNLDRVLRERLQNESPGMNQKLFRHGSVMGIM